MYERRYSVFTLRDRTGKILLQRRDSKTTRNPEHWGFFGGNIEAGESPRDALVREAREELGLENVSFKFFGRYDIREGDALHEKFLFVAQLKESLDDLRKRQKEGSDLGVFAWDDLRELKIPKGDWVLHRDLFGKSRKVGVLEAEKV
jgi:8-oxo-dGTP pyrophosphatase MutT (NUDIX family)